MGISEALDIEIRSLKKPKFIYTSQATTLMKDPKPKEIDINTELLMQEGGRNWFPNLWETIR